MKRLFLFIAFISISLTYLMAGEVTAPVNVYARQVTSLNGQWKFFVDPQENGYYDYRMHPMRGGFFIDEKAKRPSDRVEYSFDESKEIKVPGDWNTQDERLYYYEGSAWYRQKFNWTPQTGRRSLLYFGAVNYLARVWVNGKKVGEHEGGFTPFCFDVTDVVKEGENTVIVMVNNVRRKENIPTGIFDWWNYGGITRDVMMVSAPDTYVEDYTVQLAKEQPAKGNQQLIDASVRLNDKKADQQVSISIPELKINKVLTTDANGEAKFSFKAKPVLWTCENPKLYKVIVATGDESITDNIGFRTITTSGKQILLNGKPIFLRGVCAHEETAYTDRRCTTAEEADTLIAWAKEMNCNFMRLAHYPHNEHAIRECERQGILLWEELPCYWTIDWTNENTFANAKRQLRDMIQRDHNRANVIIWSVANETPHSDARDKFLSGLAQYVRTQDSTRLVSMAMEVTGASNYVNRLNDNMNKYVDVISFNEYIGWYRDMADASKMKWEIPYDKPIIISEFGGGAVAGMHGDVTHRWTEEFQEKLIQENLLMLSKIDGLSGTTPWVLKDFRSPRRLHPVIQGDFNRKGMVSDQGKRKKAFYVMQKFYAEKKQQYGF